MSYASIGGAAVRPGTNATVEYDSEGAVVTPTSTTSGGVAYVHIPVPSPANAQVKLSNYWVQCNGVQGKAVATNISINYGRGDPIESRQLRGSYGDIKEDSDSTASDFSDDFELPKGINVTLQLNFTDKVPFKIHSVSLGFTA